MTNKQTHNFDKEYNLFCPKNNTHNKSQCGDELERTRQCRDKLRNKKKGQGL